MAHLSLEFYAKSLARKTHLDLILPSLNLHESLKNEDGNYYQNLNKAYPLMICLHGFGDDEKGWQNNTSIIKLAEEHEFAVCFINGENKWYLPMGPIEDHYSLIECDILDFLYGNFKCLSKDMPLAICGVSMGGYGAMYHYLKNIDKYICGIALSPALKPDSFSDKEYELETIFLENKNKDLNIYLSVGDKDFIYKPSMQLNEVLKANLKNVSYKTIPGADHSWNTWRVEIENVIDYLYQVGFIKK